MQLFYYTFPSSCFQILPFLFPKLTISILSSREFFAILIEKLNIFILKGNVRYPIKSLLALAASGVVMATTRLDSNVLFVCPRSPPAPRPSPPSGPGPPACACVYACEFETTPCHFPNKYLLIYLNSNFMTSCWPCACIPFCCPKLNVTEHYCRECNIQV